MDILNSINTWLSARLRCRIGKRVLEIIRSQTNNDKKTDFKPTFQGTSIELDALFVDLHFPKQAKEFDAWLHIQSLGNKIILDLPIKFHKQFNKYFYQDWTLNKSVRLIRKNHHFEVEFFF